MPGKVLIVYGTRFGATESTSEEIAKVIREEGLEVTVVNAKKESVKDISGYDLIIVGSGMMIDRWTKEPENFLKKFQKELEKKKLAMFVSSAAQATIEHDKKFTGRMGGQTVTLYGDEAIGRGKKVYLEEKAAKYGLKPISMAVFGGVWDYNRMPWYLKKGMEMAKPTLLAAELKESQPGVFDTRDWEMIRSWAKEMAGKAKE
jgi:menaquinone-dependent protoporphyrinogen IX oxidase